MLKVGLVFGVTQLVACATMAGTFYVTCVNGNDVFQFDSTGHASPFVSINSPVGIAVDPSGTLYVSSISDNAIYKVLPDKTVIPFVTGLNVPYGIAFNSQGDLFVANNGSSQILRINQFAGVSVFATLSTHPGVIAFDAQGNLYAQRNSISIAKITPDGTVSTFATGINFPAGMAFDQAGTMYVANAGTRNEILKLSPAGVVSSFVPTNIIQPYGLALGSDGILYVTDNVNRIDTVDLSTGTIHTLVPYQIGLDTPTFMVEVPEPAFSTTELSLMAVGIFWYRRSRAVRTS